MAWPAQTVARTRARKGARLGRLCACGGPPLLFDADSERLGAREEQVQPQGRSTLSAERQESTGFQQPRFRRGRLGTCLAARPALRLLPVPPRADFLHSLQLARRRALEQKTCPLYYCFDW